MGVWTNFSAILFSLLTLFSYTTCESEGDMYSSLSDVTYKMGGAPLNGTVAAFGDFNSDQHTDIFFIVNEGIVLFNKLI